MGHWENKATALPTFSSIANSTNFSRLLTAMIFLTHAVNHHCTRAAVDKIFFDGYLPFHALEDIFAPIVSAIPVLRSSNGLAGESSSCSDFALPS
jgi:hypothetical protein